MNHFLYYLATLLLLALCSQVLIIMLKYPYYAFFNFFFFFGEGWSALNSHQKALHPRLLPHHLGLHYTVKKY